MVISLGTTFPENWQYGPEEIGIFRSTISQVERHFPDQNNLIINTGDKFTIITKDNERNFWSGHYGTEIQR